MDVAEGQLGAPFRNEVLASLPAEEVEWLRPLLRRVTLGSGQVLHASGEPIEDVFFMEQGLASLTADTSDEGAVEVGMTGREGFVGVSALLMPGAPAMHRAFIQIPGAALRMGVASFREAVEQSRDLRRHCLRYTGMLMVQTAQTAACNARHDMAERLARWLLMSLDRVDGDHLPLTQEFLAFMLGVRRAGVVVAASALQADDLIRYSRGRITVLDRPGLEAVACTCYGIVKQFRGEAQGG